MRSVGQRLAAARAHELVPVSLLATNCANLVIAWPGRKSRSQGTMRDVGGGS